MSDPVIHVEPGERWFVWTKKGRAPHFAHATQDAAMAEAERLARLQPGSKFHVMQSVAKVSFQALANRAEAA